MESRKEGCALSGWGDYGILPGAPVTRETDRGQTIMLIRHAEADMHSLTPRGWERAGALVPFFTSPGPSTGIRTPTHLYALGIAGDASKSLISQQTLTPLAEKLGLNLRVSFSLGQEARLAADIHMRGGVALVAWEHSHIPLIAKALSGDAPSSWPKNRFDLVWILAGDSLGTYSFAQVNQSLLVGDR